MLDDFQPFFDLWTMSADYLSKTDIWLHNSFLSLDASGVSGDVDKWWKQSYRLRKNLERISPNSSKIAGVLREKAQDFRSNGELFFLMHFHYVEVHVFVRLYLWCAGCSELAQLCATWRAYFTYLDCRRIGQL